MERIVIFHNNFFWHGLALSILCIFGGCNCNHKGRLVKEETELAKFHAATSVVRMDTMVDATTGTDLYLDYSGSMKYGIIQTYSFFDRALSIIDSEGSRAFIVGDGLKQEDFSKIATDQKSDSYARNVSNYGKRQSQLKLAMDAILTQKREAVFVTDFKLENLGANDQPGCPPKNTIITIHFNNSPWARSVFESWLCEGNGITVLSSAFTNLDFPASSPRIYYIVFWLKRKQTQESIIQRLEAATPHGFGNFERVDFSTQGYRLNIQYGGKRPKERGLGSDIESLDHWINVDEGYAYYEIKRSRMLNAFKLSKYQASKILLEDLFFYNPIVGYDSAVFGLSVHNISEPLNKFMGGSKLAFSQEKFKGKFGTAPQGSIEKVGWFELDAKWNAGGHCELRVRVIDPKRIPNSRGVYRLEIWLLDARHKWQNNWDGILSWLENGNNCVWMSALRESLREAVSRCPLQNRLLFTYYIEIAN